MTKDEPGVWGFHGGEAARNNSPFFTSRCIAIGWAPSRDLSKLAPERPAFREMVNESWPARAAKGANSVGVAAGQLFRFVHEINARDLIMFPIKRGDVRLAIVTGPYRHDLLTLPEYPHKRSVRWLGSMPKTAFSPEAMRELGSALTLFTMKTHAQEFLKAAAALQLNLAENS
jgi:restriction system protein